jgi:RNA polymerase sigma-70 factor (ECF subfamily)
MTELQTDEELVELVQEGDISAYDVLVRRYLAPLSAFAYRLIGNKPAAEEAVSDALFSVYKTIDRVDTRKKFSSYVFAVTRNAAISRVRREKQSLPLNEEVLSADDTQVYERMVKREEAREIRHAVSLLPPKYKSVVELYFFHEVSYSEIGKRLRIPVNTVRTHLRRAKKLLKKRIPYEKSV